MEEQTIDLNGDNEGVSGDLNRLSCPETLMTQIGVEETNIKKIGVSGTKPKGVTGSMTER